jgi:hypothetical protein
VAERQVQSADDADGRGLCGLGWPRIGTASADDADGVAASCEVPGQICEELTSACRVGVEELIEEEDAHGESKVVFEFVRLCFHNWAATDQWGRREPRGLTML